VAKSTKSVLDLLEEALPAATNDQLFELHIKTLETMVGRLWHYVPLYSEDCDEGEEPIHVSRDVINEALVFAAKLKAFVPSPIYVKHNLRAREVWASLQDVVEALHESETREAADVA
jgi:hypothetical protein